MPDAGVTATVVVGLMAVAGIVAAIVAARREQRDNRGQIAAVAEALAGATQPPTPPPVPSEDGTTAPRQRRGAPTTVSPGAGTDDQRSEERMLAGVAARVETRFTVQQIHYQRALQQSTTYFYVSVVAAIAGFALVLVGVALALAGKIPIGTVTAIGGVLASGAAALIFTQANQAKSDAQTNLGAIARSTEEDEKHLLAFLCTARIQDGAVRDATNAALARKLISADTDANTQ